MKSYKKALALCLALSCTTLTGCFWKKSAAQEPPVKEPLASATLAVAGEGQMPPVENKSATLEKNPAVADVPLYSPARKLNSSIDVDLKNTTDPLEKATLQFEIAMFEMLSKADKNLLPSREKPSITTLPDGKMCVTYLEVDKDNIELLVTPSTDPKSAQFIGRVRYVESLYEGIGTNKEDIMKSHFARIQSRRITELARYVNGKWLY